MGSHRISIISSRTRKQEQLSHFCDRGGSCSSFSSFGGWHLSLSSAPSWCGGMAALGSLRACAQPCHCRMSHGASGVVSISMCIYIYIHRYIHTFFHSFFNSPSLSLALYTCRFVYIQMCIYINTRIHGYVQAFKWLGLCTVYCR